MIFMKIINMFKYMTVMSFLAFGTVVVSCSGRKAVLTKQAQRLDSYVNSDNEHIAKIFLNENLSDCGVQPAMTQTELYILDELVNRIDLETLDKFDQKYFAWLICWASCDSIQLMDTDVRQSLKCNGREFKELIEFCRQQDDDIFLLLYQLAARASCPYDRLLLHPAYELLADFPEFNAYWQEVDLSLQKEKPFVEKRICNEATIWQTRKILETRYGYKYTTGLIALFDPSRL